MTTTREFFITQFAAERPKFVNVIRAIPEGKLDYRPHERSTPAGGIAWFLVLELRALADLVKSHENHWQQPAPPKTTAAIASEYEKAAAEMETLLKSTDEAAWARDSKMFVGDRLIKSAPLGETLWDFFLDAIHHRGQLSSYLRPMGAKVPSM